MKALDGKNAAVCILSSVHIFSIPHCVVRPLGWVSRFISTESLSCRISKHVVEFLEGCRSMNTTLPDGTIDV